MDSMKENANVVSEGTFCEEKPSMRKEARRRKKENREEEYILN